MAKDPAINWYFDNWDGGTKLLTRHQKGCYMDLLSAQFHSGPLSLENVKTVLGVDFQAAWPNLSKKFSETNGLFFNERMEAERQKRSAYSESRSQNRRKKDMINISKTHDEDMNNTPGIGIETDTEISDKGVQGEKTERFSKPSLPELQEYFLSIGVNGTAYEQFFDHYESNGWKVGKSPMKNWQAACRKWKSRMNEFKKPDQTQPTKSRFDRLNEM